MNQIKQTGKLSLLAVGSILLGISSFLGSSIFTGIPAIILGYIAATKIKKSQGELQGKKMAIAGMSLGILSILILIGAIIAANQARDAAQSIIDQISEIEQTNSDSTAPQ